MAELIAFPKTPRAAAKGGAAGSRLWQVDALRGLMLVLMTFTHVPTRFSSPAGQPFGYVSAAEGFVLLSAFMAGWIYTLRQQKRGEPEMRSAFMKRVLKIYLSQAALLIFLFSAVAAIGLITRQTAITDLVSFYLQHPVEAIVGALLLLYNPPMLDILPMYILFMLGSSAVLIYGMRRGWGGMMVASVGLWLGAQFGLGRALYDGVVAPTGLAIPFAETGAFEILAWQFLWMIGLWMGASHAAGVRLNRFPRWLVATAVAIATTGFVWRHAVGQAPFPVDRYLNIIFDKWQLAPLRLINLFALMVLAMHFEPWLTRRLPRLRALEVLGAASLPVFCAHLVIALLLLAIFGVSDPERPLALDVLMLGGSFALLYGVALVSRAIDRHAAKVRTSYEAARAARLSAGDRRSPISRWRTRQR